MVYPVLTGTVQGISPYDRSLITGGVQAGDWLYACIYFIDNVSVDTVTVPDGFVELASDTWTFNGTWPAKMALYRKLATASEPSSYAFTSPNGLIAVGSLASVRGGDSHAFDKLKETSGNLTRFPSVTPPVDQALVLIMGGAFAVGSGTGDWCEVLPSGFSPTEDAQGGFGFAYRQQPTAGATGIASQAQSAPATAANPNITFTVAVMPPAPYPPSTKKARRVLGGRPLARTAWMSDASKTVLANSFFDNPTAQPPTVARPVAWAFFLE